MLGTSTLAAISILATATTANPPVEAPRPISQEIAIRSVVRHEEPDSSTCKACENFNFPGFAPYLMTPERRALLNTIRFAEGTWKDGDDSGYRVSFGGSLFSSLESHPDKVRFSSRYASAAAGAYQFMPFTWREAAQKLALKTFHPRNQDQAALFLIQRRGALPLADKGEMTPTLSNRLAPEWASFPTYGGRSYYGQPVKSFSELRKFYENNLKSLRELAKQQESTNV